MVMTAIERVLGNAEERHPNELVIPGAGDVVVEQYLENFLYLKGTLQLAREAADKAITPALAAELGREYAMLKDFQAYERERREVIRTDTSSEPMATPRTTFPDIC